MLEQGPDFWRWFYITRFSCHCVHPIHAKVFSIQMLLHFSQIVPRVCTLVLFIIMASLLSGVIRSLLCKPPAFSPAIPISCAFMRRALVQSIIRRNYTRLHEHAHLIHVHVHLHYLCIYTYLYCGYGHEGGKRMYRTSERSVFS